MKKKTLTIIDFFNSNSTNEDNFIETVEAMRSLGDKILLVTGGKITERVQENVDYILYNGDNLLFEDEDYEYFHPWNYQTLNQGFIHNSFNFSTQKHGLAVLINIFNSLNYARSLGYTHFRRILYDIKPGKISIQSIRDIEKNCLDHNKKGVFYFNLPNIIEGKEYPDIKGDFFFSEIDFFLSSVPHINSESSYKNCLFKNFGSNKFLIIEKFMYEFLKEKDEIVKRDGFLFESDFSDTNREIYSNTTSGLNFPKKYKSVITRITSIKNEDSCVLYTRSYANNIESREILIKYEDGSRDTISFEILPYNWCYQFIGSNVSEIEVYGKEGYLYTEKKGESRDYIEFE